MTTFPGLLPGRPLPPAPRRHPLAVTTARRDALALGALGVLALASPAREAAALQGNNQPPVAATTGPYTSTALTVVLDGSRSFDPDGPTAKLTYAWTFGDGRSGSGVQVPHEYPGPGTYPVTLVVTDHKGARSQPASTTVAVLNNTPPVAAAGGPYSGTEGAAVAFDGRGSSDADGDALTYAWAFGDGTTGTGAQPTHVYAQNGSYTVTLTVTDAQGASSAPATTTATVANVVPTVSATLSASSIVAGTAVTLSGSFTDPGTQDGPWATTIVWGDGSANTVGSAATATTPVSATHTYATAGSYTVTLRVTDRDGGEGSAQRTLTVTAPATSTVILIAGDIADCGRNQDELTANILDAYPTATVFTAGDNVYPYGTLAAYNDCYQPSWGRHKARTWPVVGNHEYTSEMPNAEGYHAYFGERAGPIGKAYYTTTFGDWQVIVLNSEISMKAGSLQETWLRDQLARSTKQCTLAVWHRPRFFSGTVNMEVTIQKAVWNALYAAGAELIIGGHLHNYERFAPQSSDGIADPVRGIRQIIVGTGGKNAANFGTPAPNSEIRAQAFGVLKLTLGSNTYSWEFLPAAGSNFTDSGSGTCH